MVVDWDELREKYGENVVDKIKNEIVYLNANNYWRLEKFGDHIALITPYDVTVLEVKDRKIVNRIRITSEQTEKALKWMDDLWEMEYG